MARFHVQGPPGLGFLLNPWGGGLVLQCPLRWIGRPVLNIGGSGPCSFHDVSLGVDFLDLRHLRVVPSIFGMSKLAGF